MRQKKAAQAVTPIRTKISSFLTTDTTGRDVASYVKTLRKEPGIEQSISSFAATAIHNVLTHK
jgi:hypothetical protein